MHQSIEIADVCEIVDIEALYLRIHIVLEKRKIVGRHQSPSKEVDFCVVYLQFCWKICVRLHMFNMELGSNKRRQIVQRTIFEFINEIGLTRQKKKQLPQPIPNLMNYISGGQCINELSKPVWRLNVSFLAYHTVFTCRPLMWLTNSLRKKNSTEIR